MTEPDSGFVSERLLSVFGYVRPYKPELLIREFTRYRSAYCGICMQIARDYGQLPRLSVSYDMTFLALLLLSLQEEQPSEIQSGCILNPLKKKNIIQDGTVMEICAALSVLFAWHKANDSVHDEHPVTGTLSRMVFHRAFKRASEKFPEQAKSIRDHMLQLQTLEEGPPDISSINVFGSLLESVFNQAANLILGSGPVSEGIALIGRDLGRWIMLLDAIDDWADDCDNNNWNPLGAYSQDEARNLSENRLKQLETSMDRTAAVLPYVRDGGLMANLFTLGLPDVRRRIFSKIALIRL